MPITAPKWIKGEILNVLRWLPDNKSLTRRKIVDQLVIRLLNSGEQMKARATIEREVRLALAELVREGYPIANLGNGFFLASTKTQREEAARKIDRLINTLSKKAKALRGNAVPGEERQQRLVI